MNNSLLPLDQYNFLPPAIPRISLCLISGTTIFETRKYQASTPFHAILLTSLTQGLHQLAFSFLFCLLRRFGRRPMKNSDEIGQQLTFESTRSSANGAGWDGSRVIGPLLRSRVYLIRGVRNSG